MKPLAHPALRVNLAHRKVIQARYLADCVLLELQILSVGRPRAPSASQVTSLLNQASSRARLVALARLLVALDRFNVTTAQLASTMITTAPASAKPVVRARSKQVWAHLLVAFAPQVVTNLCLSNRAALPAWPELIKQLLGNLAVSLALLDTSVRLKVQTHAQRVRKASLIQCLRAQSARTALLASLHSFRDLLSVKPATAEGLPVIAVPKRVLIARKVHFNPMENNPRAFRAKPENLLMHSGAPTVYLVQKGHILAVLDSWFVILVRAAQCLVLRLLLVQTVPSGDTTVLSHKPAV